MYRTAITLLILIAASVACQKDEEQLDPVVPVEKPVVDPDKKTVTIFPYCRPFVANALTSEAEIPVYAMAVSFSTTVHLRSEHITCRMLSGPTNAVVKQIVDGSFLPLVKLENLISGEYKFEITASYDGYTAKDTLPLSVLKDTLAGKQYNFQTTWIYNDDWYPYTMILQVNRPDLFYSSGNRKIEVEMKLQGSDTWTRISDKPALGDKFIYQIMTCERMLFLLPADYKDVSVLNQKAEVRVKFL